MKIIPEKKRNKMLLKEAEFHKHIQYLRKHAKEIWLSFLNSGAINGFKTFKPTMIRYSRINKKYRYSDLGYYAHYSDYLDGVKKVDNLLENKPKRGSYFVYLYENDTPKYIYQNNGEIGLLGGIIYKVNENLRYSFSSLSNHLSYIVEVSDCTSYLERITIESNGEMISSIIYSKNDKKYYRLECQILYDLLEEITFDEKMNMYAVKSVHKILRSDTEIKHSKEESKISLPDEYITLLKQSGFNEYK